MTDTSPEEVATTLSTMPDGFTLLASGCVFGLAGGFTPGPTTKLVVAQMLRFGVFDGMKVAIAPALTDAPVILVSVLLVGQLTQFGPVLGVISLLGAASAGNPRPVHLASRAFGT